MRGVVWLVRVGSREVPIAKGETRIGRSPDCEIRIDDPLVSRFHATLIADEDGIRIRDENSRHGVTVAGEPVQERELKPNEIVMIGQTTVTVVSPGRKRRERMATLQDARFPGMEELEEPPTGGATATHMTEALMAISVRDLLKHNQTETAGPIVQRLLLLLGDRERAEGADPATLRAASRAAVRMADVTDQPGYLEALAELHRARPRVMAVTTVDAIEELLVRKGWRLPDVFFAYTQQLAERVLDFDDYERRAFEKLIRLQG